MSVDGFVRQHPVTLPRAPALATIRKARLLCLSHLRWGFVTQRPQHLMSRFAREYELMFWEEPVPCDEARPWLEIHTEGDVWVLTPRLPHGCAGENADEAQRALLDAHLAVRPVDDLVLWYYTPMALAFTEHLTARAIVYDCMDELSAFRGAPAAMMDRERELLGRADVVFTGGYSLWEAKRARHPNVHAFPSSVDVAHFAAARTAQPEPEDQAGLPRPRLGFFGVIDERFDIELVAGVADLRPEWQFVLVGPIVKIDPADLPRRANIHYLGSKTYAELPGYLSGWDVAIMPFAKNASTRFISPTKTPEYLAGGRPVVSTSIRDVVRGWGEAEAVHLADHPVSFVGAVERALSPADRARVIADADARLRDMSWDRTFDAMKAVMGCV